MLQCKGRLPLFMETVHQIVAVQSDRKTARTRNGFVKACGGCFRNLKEAHYSTANFITLMFLVLRLYSILLEQSKKPREWAGYNLFARLDQGQVWTLLLGQGLHLVVNHC